MTEQDKGDEQKTVQPVLSEKNAEFLGGLFSGWMNWRNRQDEDILSRFQNEIQELKEENDRLYDELLDERELNVRLVRKLARLQGELG